MTPRRSRGKGYVEPCWICGERRHTDGSHFPKAKRPGKEGKVTIRLCPTHHRLLDDGRLSSREYEAIMTHPSAQDKFGRPFAGVEEFVSWANDNGYDYSVEELKMKFWNHEPIEYARVRTKPEKAL
jgi:hypothetical protein